MTVTRTNRRTWLLGLSFISLMGGSLLQAADKVDLGLPLGSQAPNFKATTAKGVEITLEQLLPQKPQEEYLALIFYRSADW